MRSRHPFVRCSTIPALIGRGGWRRHSCSAAEVSAGMAQVSCGDWLTSPAAMRPRSKWGEVMQMHLWDIGEMVSGPTRFKRTARSTLKKATYRTKQIFRPRKARENSAASPIEDSDGGGILLMLSVILACEKIFWRVCAASPRACHGEQTRGRAVRFRRLRVRPAQGSRVPEFQGSIVFGTTN
jgi:hypothetical protein